MAEVAAAIEAILTAHLPFPALVVDIGWDLVSADDAVYALLDGVAPHLLEPPVNVIRLTLDPAGLAPRIANLADWGAHARARLRREYHADRDHRLAALLDDLDDGAGSEGTAAAGILVPLRLHGVDGGPELCCSEPRPSSAPHAR